MPYLFGAETVAIDLSSFIAALTSAITPAQVLGILTQIVGVSVTFFLLWMGVKRAIRAFTSSVSSGKIRI